MKNHAFKLHNREAHTRLYSQITWTFKNLISQDPDLLEAFELKI